MQKLIIVIVLTFSNMLNAQADYQTGMTKALTLFQSENWQEAEALFERIAAAEPNEWLPNYYVAQINSLKSWEEKDLPILQAQLDKAQEYINAAAAISKNNPEIMVMQALIFTNWVAYDGMTYGMKYGAKVSQIYEQAYALTPDNPRVLYCRAEWGMGSAKYFGQDTSPFCKDLKGALELFANFKPESEIHPNWGKTRVLQVLKSCEE